MAHVRTSSPARLFRVRFSWHQAVVLVCFVMLLFGIAPQLGSFRRSLHLLSDATLALVGIGVLLVAATFFVAALIYWTLALKPIRYWRAMAVQGASGFTNRVLPAGLGGMGINAAFLHKSRHSVAQAAAVAVVNNSIGFIGHFVLLGLVLFLWPIGRLHATGVSFSWLPYAAVVVVLLVLAAVVLYAGKFARAAKRQIINFLRAFLVYGTKKRALGVALLLAMCNTLLTVCVFYISCRSIGAAVSFSSVFIAFTVGVAATAVTPTPGGLGGAEAGLVGGLIGFGVPAAAALAAVLLFRLLTYWLPVVPGIALFNIVLRRGYVG